MIGPARKCEVADSAPAVLQPSRYAWARRFEQPERYRPAGLPLYHDRRCSGLSTADENADTNVDDIAGPQRAVDSEGEHRSVTQPPPAVEPEPDGPHLLRFQRPLGANLSSCVPGSPLGSGQNGRAGGHDQEARRIPVLLLITCRHAAGRSCLPASREYYRIMFL